MDQRALGINLPEFSILLQNFWLTVRPLLSGPMLCRLSFICLFLFSTVCSSLSIKGLTCYPSTKTTCVMDKQVLALHLFTLWFWCAQSTYSLNSIIMIQVPPLNAVSPPIVKLSRSSPVIPLFYLWQISHPSSWVIFTATKQGLDFQIRNGQ